MRKIALLLGVEENMSQKSEVKSTTRKRQTKSALEQFELLISDQFELTRSIPISITREGANWVLVESRELNLYAEGHSEYEARRNFSNALVSQLGDLEEFETHGKELGRDLRVQLSLLKRLLRKVKK